VNGGTLRAAKPNPKQPFLKSILLFVCKIEANKPYAWLNNIPFIIEYTTNMLILTIITRIMET
jgi:hypothetical protein